MNINRIQYLQGPLFSEPPNDDCLLGRCVWLPVSHESPQLASRFRRLSHLGITAQTDQLHEVLEVKN